MLLNYLLTVIHRIERLFTIPNTIIFLDGILDDVKKYFNETKLLILR